MATFLNPYNRNKFTQSEFDNMYWDGRGQLMGNEAAEAGDVESLVTT